MRNYDLTIYANGLNHEADDFEHRLLNAGCHDATIAFQSGEIVIDFTREADSQEDAIKTAINDVKNAGANVLKVILAS